MGKSSINEEFCIAMFDYPRVRVDALHTWIGDVQGKCMHNLNENCGVGKVWAWKARNATTCNSHRLPLRTTNFGHTFPAFGDAKKMIQ